MVIETITAVTSVLKDSFGLIKIIGEAKSEAEIQKATYELNQKLTDIQLENLKLIELISSQQEEIILLREKNKDLTLFETQAEKYLPKILESGTFTYVSRDSVGEMDEPHYLCAHCYQKRVISALQPSTGKAFQGSYFIHYCPNCNNTFKMNRTPAAKGEVPKPHISKLLP